MRTSYDEFWDYIDKNNKEKVREYNRNYWNKKASEVAENE